MDGAPATGSGVSQTVWIANATTAFYRGFTSFREIFAPSAQYCLRIAEAKDYLKSLEKNEVFADFLKWAQRVSQRNYNSEDGAVDLQLGSLLTMPLQRVMKYGLLLQEILRHTEDGEERLALESMISHVTSFCNELNSTYRAKCDQAELRGVADRIEDAKLPDWIDGLGDETATVLESYRLNLMRPMPHNGQLRRRISEGDVRFKDEKGKWNDAKCLLFTDLLLLAKSSKRNSLRLLRPPLRLDRLVLHKLSDPNNSLLLVALTDFGSVDCLMCLACDSQKATDEWSDRISQARILLAAQLQQQQQQLQQQKTVALQPSAPSLQPQTSVDAVRLRNHHQQHPVHQQQQRSATVAIATSSYSTISSNSSQQLHYTRSSGDMESLLTTTISVTHHHQQQQQHQRYTTHLSSFTDVEPATIDSTGTGSVGIAAASAVSGVEDQQDARRSSHV
ncbi:hypothetical protein BOX15_Mlig006859g1 [Macrostomum lignano]|uniref:DH domain-containing protein n=1 Tax=Macrostomum lignano TaxID=282301 RepID=A0A267F662_9PLAT|nr:hypothetical protein BOX15_Mlig006859g1 [Macrostomum lignano]